MSFEPVNSYTCFNINWNIHFDCPFHFIFNNSLYIFCFAFFNFKNQLIVYLEEHFGFQFFLFEFFPYIYHGDFNHISSGSLDRHIDCNPFVPLPYYGIFIVNIRQVAPSARKSFCISFCTRKLFCLFQPCINRGILPEVSLNNIPGFPLVNIQSA